jgi:hypothetical protein
MWGDHLGLRSGRQRNFGPSSLLVLMAALRSERTCDGGSDKSGAVKEADGAAASPGTVHGHVPVPARSVGVGVASHAQKSLSPEAMSEMADPVADPVPVTAAPWGTSRIALVLILGPIRLSLPPLAVLPTIETTENRTFRGSTCRCRVFRVE